jgi:hypothetical protein
MRKEKKHEVFNGSNGFGSKRKLFKTYRAELKNPKRNGAVGVAKDGTVFIKTELHHKGKIVDSMVVYSREAVGFILSSIFSGYNEWSRKKA